MSLPEVLLWQALRQRPHGYKFRRQFPIGPITTDFACLERRLIVEVDGDQHGLGDQPQRDVGRDMSLRREGFVVMRVAALDVLKDLDSVIRGIVARCSEVGPLHQPAVGPPAAGSDRLGDGPLPGARAGEDLL
jgi:very-short-patch-repair endonuclease